MDFSFISIWTEIKGRIGPRCTDLWLLLHFALPQSGKYMSGNLLIPLLFLHVVYLDGYFLKSGCPEHTDAACAGGKSHVAQKGALLCNDQP